MPTKSEQLLAALQSTLTAAGVTHVYRSRQTAFARDEGVVTAIEAALHADRTLGGLCGMLWLKGTDWDFDDADLGAVVVTQQWDLQYLF